MRLPARRNVDKEVLASVRIQVDEAGVPFVVRQDGVDPLGVGGQELGAGDADELLKLFGKAKSERDSLTGNC